MNDQKNADIEKSIEALYEEPQRQPKEVHTVKCEKCGFQVAVPYKPAVNNRHIYCPLCFAETLYEDDELDDELDDEE